MSTSTSRRQRLASILSATAILAVGLAPISAEAADHLDAPTASSMGAADINDVYAFSTSDGGRSVFVVTVNPGAGALPNSTEFFGTGVEYNLTVDTDGNAAPDITYSLRFGNPSGGRQAVAIWRNGVQWGAGMTDGKITLSGGSKLWAGLRDDPFFFDLDAFKGNILGAENGRMLCDDQKVDFFLGLNVSAIVLMVPNAELGGNGKTVGISANTKIRRGGEWIQADQMGRPGISTVFNNRLVNGDNQVAYVKELFNRVAPSEQDNLGFRKNVVDTLIAVSTKFNNPYTPAQAEDLAKVLIPDVLTYETGNKGGFLNGRRLRDDVIDTLLSVGANTPGASDCIGNDSTFLRSFPFLGTPN